MYKCILSHYKGEKLAARANNREEAFEYGKYAIGIYKKKDDNCEELVGHTPTEISSLLYYFLQSKDEKYVEVEILGKRKREVGLVVPAKYNAFTAKRQTAKILDAQLSKAKELFASLALLHNEKRSYRMFPVHQ